MLHQRQATGDEHRASAAEKYLCLLTINIYTSFSHHHTLVSLSGIYESLHLSDETEKSLFLNFSSPGVAQLITQVLVLGRLQ